MKLQIMKKMPRVAAMGTAVLMLAGMVPAAAMADCVDRVWTFEVSYTGGSGYAVPNNRQKEDKTSSYMKCNSYTKTYASGQGNAYAGTVHGSDLTSGGLADRYVGSNHSTTYTFVQGSEKYMTNYVKEAGYSFANILCADKYTTWAKFSGVWSPDSV